MRRTQASEVHIGSAVCRAMATPMHSLPGDGSESSWHRTDAQRVAAIILLIERL